MEKDLLNKPIKKYRKYYLRRVLKRFFDVHTKSVSIPVGMELTPYQKKITKAINSEFNYELQYSIPIPKE